MNAHVSIQSAVSTPLAHTGEDPVLALIAIERAARAKYTAVFEDEEPDEIKTAAMHEWSDAFDAVITTVARDAAGIAAQAQLVIERHDTGDSDEDCVRTFLCTLAGIAADVPSIAGEA